MTRLLEKEPSDPSHSFWSNRKSRVFRLTRSDENRHDERLWFQVLSRTQLASDEDLVTERLRHESDRDASERVPDEVPDVDFGDVEPDDWNLTPPLAQLNNLIQSRNRMLKTVEA